MVHAKPVYHPGLRRQLGRAVSVPLAIARSRLFLPGNPVRIYRQFSLLNEWGTSLAGLLMSAAAREPRRVALVDDAGPLTFGEVDARTDRLAVALVAERVGPRPRIGLLCRNHRGMVESLVACSKRGAEVILLNTGLGEGQIRAVLRELRVDALVADTEFHDMLTRVPRALRRVVAWTDDTGPGPSLEDLIASAPPRELARPAVQSRTIFLSSGTTGRPKGARRRPRPGFRSLAAFASRIPLRVHDTMVVEAPLFHTWGYAAMQLCLALRGTLVLRRRFDPERTLRTVAGHRQVVLFAVPVMLQRILDLPADRRRRHSTRSLRLVAVSGAALLGDLATRFMDEFGDRLYNLYGSTEVSWVSMATPRDLRANPGCAGRPPAGTAVAILDGEGNVTTHGTRGRIFTANELLFEGYTSGTSLDTWDGLLATGDLGHFDQAGRLCVDGREDDLVVSGGENIFPREVENLIFRLPGVLDVTVRGVPDREYGQRLAAYIVAAAGHRLDADTVRRFVHDEFARYAVPRDVHFLGELPRNETGKVVPRWLPPPLVDEASTA